MKHKEWYNEWNPEAEKTNKISHNLMSKDHWLKEHLSIIWPSRTSFETYEIYDGTDIERFNTLKEAQDFWDALLKNNREIRYEETIVTCYRDEYDNR